MGLMEILAEEQTPGTFLVGAGGSFGNLTGEIEFWGEMTVNILYPLKKIKWRP